ncbi:hypothetical protein J6R97_00820 [bacterium]|nr:hypothetical protein [bacterium]
MKFFDLELGGLGSSPMRVVTNKGNDGNGNCTQVTFGRNSDLSCKDCPAEFVTTNKYFIRQQNGKLKNVNPVNPEQFIP